MQFISYYVSVEQENCFKVERCSAPAHTERLLVTNPGTQRGARVPACQKGKNSAISVMMNA